MFQRSLEAGCFEAVAHDLRLLQPTVSQVHAAVDTLGYLLALKVTPGQRAGPVTGGRVDHRVAGGHWDSRIGWPLSIKTTPANNPPQPVASKWIQPAEDEAIAILMDGQTEQKETSAVFK